MSELGWISGRFLPNNSGRFESRWATVKVPSTTNAIMLQNMQETTLGIWIAHGEGRYVPAADSAADSTTQTAMVYVDHERNATENYPENPNGSYQGITGICSKDGRHLAMMPHPERSIYQWQSSWMPSEIKEELDQLGYQEFYPWFEMFRNAYNWCKV